ncbi:Pectate lyase superfamily protein [Flavobacterium fluvii]|uniref:Pectate lyase superfamily protein n=1 Tax=Flavobacterium fluvii TaxID=468056 RepID=A0A1M5HER8_9FLAO|nr:glycosyl hydrolase family 28-related protein [Flavobacterium fluvii]SHG14443.1 Pectate lyase superfamily protein [Flavobacterium fluvii]
MKKNNINKALVCVFLVTIGFSCFAQQESAIYKEFKKESRKSILPDFSYAGYHYGEQPIPDITRNVIDVTQHGIKANSMKDQTKEVQKLIDKVGTEGGGVLYFPKGVYYFNMNPREKQFLQINHSNIVLRGENNSINGTVFFDGNPLTQDDISPWLSPALIQTGSKLQNTASFWGIDYPKNAVNHSEVISTKAGSVNGEIQEAQVLTQFTKNAKKGDKTLWLKSTAQLAANDYILLGLYNSDDAGTLIKSIISPVEEFYDFEASAKSAGPSRAPSYQWLVQIESVSKNSITLKQPLRRDFDLKYQPVLAKAEMLGEIGVENIYIKSAWAGYYCHHGCEGSDKYQGQEMDYGWNAIIFCRVANGWIKNVTLENFTSPVYLLDSRNVTVDGVEFLGFDGHSGVKIYSHACDNLIQNLNFKNNFTHVLSGEGNAYGNVFRNVNYKAVSGKPGLFDFHGFSDRRFSPPAENLFENIKGLNKISGGGAPNNLPHTANFNTWWNIELADFNDKDSELFYSWQSPLKGLVKDNLSHQMYPKSILAGVYQPQFEATLNGNTADTNDQWIYTENFNKGKVYPLSLYDAQLKLRLHKKK